MRRNMKQTWLFSNFKQYLEYLHQECLDRLALVQDSLTAYFQPTNLFWINMVFLKEGVHSCQTESTATDQRVNLR